LCPEYYWKFGEVEKLIYDALPLIREQLVDLSVLILVNISQISEFLSKVDLKLLPSALLLAFVDLFNEVELLPLEFPRHIPHAIFDIYLFPIAHFE
jgi:hypothetical protein